MFLLSRSKISWLALAILVSCLMMAGTQGSAYADDATSPYQSGAPLKPGDLTLDQVIEAHKGLPEPNQPLTPPQQQTAAPFPANDQSQSSAKLMLMQGMQSALQAPAQGGTSQLKPPQLSGTTPMTAPVLTPPAAAMTAPAQPSGVAYQAGQAPKNLAAPVSGWAPAQSTPPQAAPAAPPETVAAKPETSGLTPGCTPHTDTWVRKCSDAGYPDDFTGEIRGETRSTCPSGTLQDVWLANSCAPPGEEGEGSAALAVPAPVSETSPPVSASTAAVLASPTPAAGTVAPPAEMPMATTLSSSGSVSGASVDAGCGPANGLAVVMAPKSGDLCNSGEATSISGTGPWLWSCRGQNGGVTVSCAAPVATSSAATAAASAPAKPLARPAEDGLCGASAGIGITQAPADNLCAKGMQSHVSGEGPWTWACSGTNGGTAAACIAPKKADGECGSSSGMGMNTMPTNNLCTAGYASAVTGEGPWDWTCSGLNGGAASTCEASLKRDAICGMASFEGHKETPKGNLCSVGIASSVTGEGPWLWTCDGPGGGASVSCTADVSVSGVCGSANGVASASIPVADELCARGKPSRVTGNGPWAWNCVGSEGGDTQSCTAPRGAAPEETLAAAIATPGPGLATSASAASAPTLLAPKRTAATEPATGVISAATSVTHNEATLCGAASELAAFEAPSRDLCKAGKAGDISGEGPWTWTCTAGSHTSNCSTLTPGSFKTAEEAPAVAPTPAPAPTLAADNQPSCGTAAGQGAEAAPSDDLCALGRASFVKGKGPWTWTCAKGKQKIVCQAPKLIDALCGNANGTIRKSIPVADLCRAGKPTSIEGQGPWLWSCIGEGGGTSVSCSAAVQSQARVDGICGAAASAPAQSTPSANLCDSGMPSTVYGDGPWTWTCSGMNGGIASSCSAQKNLPPAPAPPGPVVNGLCGSSNGAAMLSQPIEGLCDAGTTTAVSGNGPWNWNCLGQNGGMTVSCTSLLQPPAPITGVCGAASGVPALSKPQSGLCAAGISSAVSGKGPWTWSCSGTNGGGAVACIAPLAGAGGGPLPSLVTPSEAPASSSAPAPAIHKGLVTPHLSSSHLSPSEADVVSTAVPSGSEFPAAPAPTRTPPSAAVSAGEAPAGEMPTLPSDAQALPPPPVRDTLKPSPALMAPAIDGEGQPIPGNHFMLPDDLSSISFARGAENIDTDAIPQLDKIVNLLSANGGVRITLTAYADNSGISPREARRLSLTRALAVRDYLTAKGISSGRIDVRALGANVPSGDPDRVDVKAE